MAKTLCKKLALAPVDEAGVANPALKTNNNPADKWKTSLCCNKTMILGRVIVRVIVVL